jgi:hypothetical protein
LHLFQQIDELISHGRRGFLGQPGDQRPFQDTIGHSVAGGRTRRTDRTEAELLRGSERIEGLLVDHDPEAKLL